MGSDERMMDIFVSNYEMYFSEIAKCIGKVIVAELDND